MKNDNDDDYEETHEVHIMHFINVKRWKIEIDLGDKSRHKTNVCCEGPSVDKDDARERVREMTSAILKLYGVVYDSKTV